MNKQFGADLIFVDDFNWNDNGKDLTGPVLQYVKDSFVRDNYLDKDKVRELVKAVDVLRNYAWDCMEGRKQEEKFVKLNCPVESLINSLFPEGGEGKEDK